MKNKILLFILLSITCAPQAVFGMKKQKLVQKTPDDLCPDALMLILDFLSHEKPPGVFLGMMLVNRNLKNIIEEYIKSKTSATHVIRPGRAFQQNSKEALAYLEKNKHPLILYVPTYSFSDDPFLLSKILSKIKYEIVKLELGITYFYPSKDSIEEIEVDHLKHIILHIADCPNLSILHIPHSPLTSADLTILGALPKIKEIYATINQAKIDLGIFKETFDLFTKKHACNLKLLSINVTKKHNVHSSVEKKFFKDIADIIAKNLKNLDCLYLFSMYYERTPIDFTTLSPIEKLKDLEELAFVPKNIFIEGIEQNFAGVEKNEQAAGEKLFNNLKKLKRLTLNCDGIERYLIMTHCLDALLKVIFFAENLKYVNLVFTMSKIRETIIALIYCGVSNPFQTKPSIRCNLNNIKLIFEKLSNIIENENKLSYIHNLLGDNIESLLKISYTKEVTFSINLVGIGLIGHKEFEKLQKDKRFETYTSVTNNIGYLNIAIRTNQNK